MKKAEKMAFVEHKIELYNQMFDKLPDNFFSADKEYKQGADKYFKLIKAGSYKTLPA